MVLTPSSVSLHTKACPNPMPKPKHTAKREGQTQRETERPKQIHTIAIGLVKVLLQDPLPLNRCVQALHKTTRTTRHGFAAS